MSERNLLRRTLRQARQSISQADQYLASEKVLLRIGRHSLFRKATSFSAYLPSDGEINLTPLIKMGLKRGKRCYLPVIDGKSLVFCRYRIGDPLAKSRYGLLEPLKINSLAASKIDLLLIPLVGFDRQGNRLGMGGGFYDRALQHIRFHNKNNLWGIGHRSQLIAEVKKRSWDVRLNGVFTDGGVFRTKG
jgi:5-formyltetrahydrofolate cyclo-ligase